MTQSTLLDIQLPGYRKHLSRKAKSKEKVYNTNNMFDTVASDSDDFEPSKKKVKKSDDYEGAIEKHNNSKAGPSKTTNSQTAKKNEISLLSDDDDNDEDKKELPSKHTKKPTQTTIENFTEAIKKPLRVLSGFFGKNGSQEEDSQPSTRFLLSF